MAELINDIAKCRQFCRSVVTLESQSVGLVPCKRNPPIALLPGINRDLNRKFLCSAAITQSSRRSTLMPRTSTRGP